MKAELKKSISVFVPLRTWITIREIAASRGIPITKLCEEWLESKLTEEIENDRNRQKYAH